VTDGLILLGLLAILAALVVGRIRRRIGLAMTGGIFLATMAAFAIAMLVLWATSRR
jgi:hypothetical protein